MSFTNTISIEYHDDIYSRTCILLNGKILEYDFCHPNKNCKEYVKNMIYLGKGKIYSINDIIQNFKEYDHFWKNK